MKVNGVTAWLLRKGLRPGRGARGGRKEYAPKNVRIKKRRGIANVLRPFRVFGLARQTGVLPRRVGLFGLAARSESLAAHSIAVSVGRSHFAVSHFFDCVVFLQVAWLTTVKLPVQYSLEFRLRLEISEPHLAGQPQPASYSHGLLVPTALTRPEDPLFAGTPARFGPPSGFGYPLDGLSPSDPRRFCFAPAALLGFALRSFLLSDGTRGHYHPV